jgi:hypothetical protein
VARVATTNRIRITSPLYSELSRMPQGNKHDDEFTIIRGGFGDVIVTAAMGFPQEAGTIRVVADGLPRKRID